MKIERLAGKAPGRSAGSAFGQLVFIATVANDRDADLVDQSRDVLARLEGQLGELGSDKAKLLSATIYLANMSRKNEFDSVWIDWIGDDQTNWPQRACVGASLAGNTAVEISIVAVRRNAIDG